MDQNSRPSRRQHPAGLIFARGLRPAAEHEDIALIDGPTTATRSWTTSLRWTISRWPGLHTARRASAGRKRRSAYAKARVLWSGAGRRREVVPVIGRIYVGLLV